MCPATFAERIERSTDDKASQRSEQAPPVATGTLVVGAADDHAEREADRVAGEVLSRLYGGGGDDAHTHGAGCGHDHGEVRRSAGASAGAEVGYEGGAISEDLTARIEGKRGAGSTLPTAVRRRLEAGFGGSLGDVRIHTDGESAQLNRAISARAFTTGRDIFFGAGEFRPDTAEGEHMLAHEIAHTRQQGGGARRTLRRWDIGARKIDWNQTVKVGTVSSGQMVYFLQDATGDKLAVKKEDRPIGLSELAAAMHQRIAGVKSVKHRPLDKGEIASVVAKVIDPSMQDVAAWTKLGAATKADPGFTREMEEDLGLAAGGLAAMPDLEVGRKVHGLKLNPLPDKMVAMTFAEGETAGSTARKADPNQMKPEKNRLRGLLTDFRHMEQLGQLTAVDLFIGNQDRVMAGNLGNWVYDPFSTAMTAIDHIDGYAATYFSSRSVAMDMHLATKRLAKTATEAVDGLVDGAEKAGDDDFGAWIKSEGGYRRQMMEEALHNGLVAGRKLLIKTFSATRFTIGGAKARAVKKAVKKAGREATAIDGVGGKDDYYKLLKARAEWLKKN